MKAVVLLAVLSLHSGMAEDGKAEERQLFGGTDLLGYFPNYQDSSALPTNLADGFSGIQHYPFPQNVQYAPETVTNFPDRPITGGQFLGQLGQYIQEGLLSQYPTVPPGFGQYQQFYQQYPTQTPAGSTGIKEALNSIAKNDDFKCVPRLLCEVAAGGRPGYSTGKQGTGIPFVSKDTLMSVLTVLNFQDNSPLMSFGRAILLGITAKGDPSTCVSAYPTCPRDPDRLIDYLNNHNGGFFKFFGTQRPYYPSYNQGRIQNGPNHISSAPVREPEEYPTTKPGRGGKHLHFSSSSNRPHISENDHRDSDYFRKETSATKTSLSFPGNANNGLSQDSSVYKTSLTFPSNGNNIEYTNKDTSNRPTVIKTFYFPEDESEISYNGFHYERLPTEHKKQTAPMIFPDRTGTGDLRLDNSNINGPAYSLSSYSDVSSDDKPDTLPFSFGERQPPSYLQSSGNRGNRSKKQKNSSVKFPSKVEESIGENDRNPQNGNRMKFPNDIIDKLFGR